MVNTGVMLLCSQKLSLGYFLCIIMNDSRGHEAGHVLRDDGGTIAFVDSAPTAGRSASSQTAPHAPEEVSAQLVRVEQSWPRQALMLSL